MYQELEKCIIRDWQMEDAPSAARYADNRKIWQNLRDGFPHPYTVSAAENFIIQVNGAKPRTVFAIATDTETIGSIGIMPGVDVHRFTSEIGYWLAEPFWGKGIMTEAVRFFTDWAFQEFKLHRISESPYAANTASCRVLEKAGYQREGIVRSGAFKDGKVVDQHLYSIIRVRAES
ncbi:MAG: GNAT family protein [Desulfobacteraceae bacterium]|jgi:RimJ/RimL family protein N-acetyltransferase